VTTQWPDGLKLLRAEGIKNSVLLVTVSALRRLELHFDYEGHLAFVYATCFLTYRIILFGFMKYNTISRAPKNFSLTVSCK
jgi:hypothetical protein